MKTVPIFLSILLTCAAFTVKAQWNTNTSVNLPISTLEVADMQTASTTDNKMWIAFYAVNGGNYDMRAQLLDANGNKLLGADGVLVSNQPSGSATFVFNVCVDASNNLIIGCQDQRSSDMQAVLYKISQTGTHLWSSNGVVLGSGLAPYPAVLSTGEVVAVWAESNSNTQNIQKITTGGTTAWGSPIPILVGTTGTTRGQTIANNTGKFTVVYQKMGFGISTTLYSQMFDNSGTALYAPLQISNQTSSGSRYYSIAAEGDTTFFGYYVSSGTRFNSFLQRINPGGSIPWGINGSNFNTSTSPGENSQMQTEICITPGYGYVWAVCTFTTPSQSQYGVYVQKFLRTTGARQLTDQAKVVYAISANSDQSCGQLALVSNTPMFMSYDVSYKIYATRLDANGNFVWPGNRVELSSTTATPANGKMRYGFNPDGPNRCAGTWTENRGIFYMGYAQGISIGGLIGLDVATQGGVPAVINTPGGTLQMVATVFPSTANQSVTWSIVPVTGGAIISTAGLVTATANGTVYAKAVAVQDATVKDSLLITISNQVPLAPSVITLAATNVLGTSATLNGSVNANGQNTTVTFNWGLTTSYGNTVAATPGTVTGNTATAVLANLTGLTVNTTYHFRCVGVNSVGTTNGSDLTFTTCQPPAAAGTISGPTSVCQGQTGVSYTTPSIQYATSYTWTVPNGATIVSGSGTNTITVDYSMSATSGSVTVAGVNSCATGTSSNLAVTVHPLPVPTISGPVTPCMSSGNFTYFTETGMNNYSWTVSSGGTIVSGSGTSSVVVQWTAAGPQTLSVNYSNSGGCLAATPTVYNVTVSEMPGAAGPISGDSELCAGTAGVPYTVDPISGANAYIWTLPAGATVATGSGTNSITVDFNDNAVSGDITVAGNSVCGNGPSSSLAVTVNPIPETPVVDSSGFVLTSSAPVGNQWYKDGIPIGGATGQQYTVSQNGWYWTVVTINGCPSAASNQVYFVITGAVHSNIPSFRILPVPNKGIFTVTMYNPSGTACALEIFDRLGVCIFQKSDIETTGITTLSIELRHPVPGVYCLVISDGTSRSIQRFVVADP